MYSYPVDIRMTCSTSGAMIHYTIDGTTPTELSPQYSTPLHISSDTIVKAKAFKYGWHPSTTNTEQYTITGTVSNPIFSPMSGMYNGPIDISMSCSPTDANIYYTTDGTEPSENSILYRRPVLIYSDAIIKARAFKSNWLPSGMQSAKYNIYHDLNKNLEINIEDMCIISYYWKHVCESPSWCEGADCDQNGYVGLSDLLLIANKWLTTEYRENMILISGTVMYGCASLGCPTPGQDPVGMVGTELVFSNGGGSVVITDDWLGYYEHYVPAGWRGTVTPISVSTPDGMGPEYCFVPRSIDYLYVQQDQTDQNYEGFSYWWPYSLCP
jgi:hypothetical protein